MAAYVGSINAPLSTGNVSYSSVGFLPKALILWGATTASSGEQNIASGSQFGAFYGLTDGTDSYSASVASGDTASFPVSYGQDTSVLRLLNTTGTIIAEAEIVSFDNDGFTLNWTTAPSAAYIVNFLALGGTAMSAKVGTFSITATGAQNIVGTGFTPTGCVFLSFKSGTLPLASTANLALALGVDDGTRAFATGVAYRDGATDPTNGVNSPTYSIALPTDANTPASDVNANITAFGSDGFTVTAAEHTTNTTVGYLALSGSFYAGTDNSPGSVTTLATTGVGFEPEAVLLHGAYPLGADADANESGNMCLGAGDGTRQRELWHGREPISSANQGISQRNDAVWLLPATEGDIGGIETGVGNQASLQSLDAGGFTTNHTVANVARAMRFMAFAGGPVSGTFDNKLIYADGISVT